MPSNLKTQTFEPPPNPSRPNTAEWFYNEIMRRIEPDLMTTVIPHHEEMYKNETKEQGTARMKAYDEAFVIFDKISDSMEKDLHEGVKKLKRQAHQEAVKKEEKERKEELPKIEEEMRGASSGDTSA